MIARTHLKLEKGILQFIEATKSERLDGLNIVAGHGDLEPAMPYLSVWGGNSSPHPDFDGCGRGYPELVQIGFGISHNSADAAFEETLGKWLDELDSILTAPAEEGDADYSALIAFLNQPAAPAEDTRDFGPLHVTAVHPDADADEIGEEVWDASLSLEIVATNANHTA